MYLGMWRGGSEFRLKWCFLKRKNTISIEIRSIKITGAVYTPGHRWDVPGLACPLGGGAEVEHPPPAAAPILIYSDLF